MDKEIFRRNKTQIKLIYFLGIFILSSFILRSGVLCADDTFLNFYEFGISLDKDFLYGTWIMQLNNFIMYWLPYKLGLNLQTWAGSVGVLTQAFCITLMMFFFNKFAIREKIPLKISLPFNLLVYMLIFISFYNLKTLEFIIFSAFFRFMIPAFLLIIFSYYLYRVYNGEQKYLIPCIIMTFITASASEIVTCISITMLLCVCIVKIFKATNKREILSYLLLLLTAIIAGLCLFTSSGFHTHVAIKIHNEPINFIDKLAFIPEFLKLYYEKIILNYWIVYTTIIILFILNFIKNIKERNGLEKILYPLFPILGILIFNFLLIFMGKTNYDGNFWLTHIDIHAAILPIFALSIVLSSFQFFTRYFIQKRKICSIIIMFSIICLSFPFYQDVEKFQNIKENVRKFIYLKDKIRLFYEYKGEKPIMPLQISKFEIIFETFNPEIIDIDNFSKQINDNAIDSVKIRVEEEEYYKSTYNKNVINHFDDIILKDYNEAIKKFKAEGGSYKEIKAGKYRFTDLEDKNFVLKGKK